MDLIEIKGLVSTLAVITTILQFLSGTLVCRTYMRNRTTGEASPLPFLCGAISAGLWLLYGLTKQDNKIILVNSVGITLMVAYTLVFYVFTYKKLAILKQILVVVCLFLLILGYAATEADHEILLSRVGLVACSLTLVTVAAPMSKLMYVLKTKNTECLPFPMILMSFFVSSLWCVYGVIEQDTYLILPNLIGAMLALAQLSLFVVFPGKSQSMKPILA